MFLTHRIWYSLSEYEERGVNMQLRWKIHGDGARVAPGAVVNPDERLRWPRMASLGAQHVIAMFGATTLVPLLTGFPVATTLFFSGIGTIIFLLVTGNRVPSYTGSSFAFIAPVVAAQTDGGMAAALCGIFFAGVALAIVGMIIDRVGYESLNPILPPVVTGTIVALVGLNIAPVAKDQFTQQAGVAIVTLCAVLLIGVFFRGFVSRLSIFLGVVIGYLFAAILGNVDFTAVKEADWIGLPDFTVMTFSLRAILLVVPAVIIVVLVENAAHVKAVGSMTGRSLDDSIGKAFTGGGIGTALAGLFGGSATVTYAENIGVMSFTRIYSTAAYWFAGIFAICLALVPKFGALISTIPVGVLGGVSTVLFGMISVIGLRIYVEGRVDFGNPVNLSTAAIGLLVGAGNYTLNWGDYTFAGVALGSIGAIAVYQILLRAPAVTRPAPLADRAAAPEFTASPRPHAPEPRGSTASA
jgi:uracil-xanthine permease